MDDAGGRPAPWSTLRVPNPRPPYGTGGVKSSAMSPDAELTMPTKAGGMSATAGATPFPTHAGAAAARHAGQLTADEQLASDRREWRADSRDEARTPGQQPGDGR